VTLRLAEPEAVVLEAFARRQLAWDAGQAARVVTTPRALGVFTSPPMGVLVFFAVPVRESDTTDQHLDATVPLAALADLVHRDGTTGMNVEDLPRALLPASSPPSLHHLPPTEGWQMPIQGLSGDLLPSLDEATTEFQSRSQGLPPRAQEAVAQEIWDRTGFAGLPMRVLHAAHRLGMISNDRSRVAAATCGPWKRLSTPRGQVFTYLQGPSARLALHVVR
jgi:hypothetical protein